MNAVEDKAPLAHDARNTPQIASANFAYDSLYLAIGTYTNRKIKIGVPKGLTRRTVFASFLNGQYIDASAKSGQQFSGTLDFNLAGNLVYRMPFERHVHNIPGYNAVKVSVRPACSEAESNSSSAPVYPGFQPAVGDSLLATILNTEHVCPPWHINIACDQILLQLDDVVLEDVGGFLLACQSEGESE